MGGKKRSSVEGVGGVVDSGVSVFHEASMLALPSLSLNGARNLRQGPPRNERDETSVERGVYVIGRIAFV